MRDAILSLDDELRATSRVPALAGGGAVRPAEVATLLLAGAVASLLTNLVRLRLGIPGSSIVFAVFPIALGFALVPRRGAGTVMAGGALATTLALWLAGVRLDGVGAQTSLLLTGPLLDVALRWGARGWRPYLAFLAAGAASNAMAFVVRGATKLAGVGGGVGGPRGFGLWWPRAVGSYAVAGLVAGLIGALAWFHFRSRDADVSGGAR
ncbi:MAG TPA: hypothetical protein VFS44_07870 [Gemmatimonadaceae bacterium]|nr:hypothetical protein [Gemmatimonadaceae bacterium]